MYILTNVQVHETVDINHPPEIRAEAAAKATVAAFAASEGHAHPRVIELPKVPNNNICLLSNA